jgi:hypothetical protein
MSVAMDNYLTAIAITLANDFIVRVVNLTTLVGNKGGIPLTSVYVDRYLVFLRTEAYLWDRQKTNKKKQQYYYRTLIH